MGERGGSEGLRYCMCVCVCVWGGGVRGGGVNAGEEGQSEICN